MAGVREGMCNEALSIRRHEGHGVKWHEFRDGSTAGREMLDELVVVRVVFFFFSSRRRHTRFDCDWSSDVCSSDLWAKGLEGRIVVYKHALKNALIPVVTIVGGQLGTLLAGTVVVETIFALPGMGRLTVEAILFRDYPVVQTNVMLVATTLVTLNLLVDLTYAWLDPRIHYQ